MSTNLRSTFWILTVASAGMGALLAFLPAAGHDQLWCLYAARHVLDGTPLYGPELMESNPPLIIWLSMVPAALAHLLHLPAPAAGKVLVALAEALVAVLCMRQLRRVLPLSCTQVAALAFAFVTLFDVVPARDLGQRDYLLALFCLPYLLAAAGRAADLTESGLAESVLVGALAGIGLALKPHQAVLPVAVEIYLMVRRRSPRSLWRPEPFAILLAGVAYLWAIRRFAPEFLAGVLPILRDAYWAVGSLTLAQLIWQAIELHILAAIAIGVVALNRRRPAARWALDPGPPFVVAGCASTLAYYLQGTGWYYQQLPAIAFFALALVFESLRWLDRPVSRLVPKAALGLGAVALVLTTHFMGYPFTEARSFPVETPDPAFFEGLRPGTAVATLTTTVDYTVMPAERYHLTIAQRYPHLWMLPAILRSEDGDGPKRIAPGRLAELDALQHRFMVEDLRRWQPELVLVERCEREGVPCQLLDGRTDDLLAWFLRDPAFTLEWRNYAYVGSRGQFDGYRRR